MNALPRRFPVPARSCSAPIGRLTAIVLLCSITPRLLVAAPPDSRPPVTDREATLWTRIEHLREPIPRTDPFDSWFQQAHQRRKKLLDRLTLYLTLYPGGPHRDQALTYELETRYELATLGDGSVGPLCRRVDQLLADPPSPVAEQEAAFWKILCQRVERGPRVATQPATQPFARLDPHLRQAYTRYIQTYPTARRVPRLVSQLFADAQAQNDRGRLQRLVDHLLEHFPYHATTATLGGVWKRLNAPGEPFHFALTTLDGTLVDTHKMLGHPLLIVVWAGFDTAARRTARQVEEFRQNHPNFRVIGINIDETPKQAIEAARRLQLPWPQFNDGLGWGNAFLREWGLTSIPWVFVIDAQGRLHGATDSDVWGTWASDLSAGLSPTTAPARSD